MRRVLLLSGATLALLLLVAAALLARGVNVGIASPWVERMASDALGRELRLATAPRLELDSGLRLTLRDVSLANADWATEKPLARLDFAEVLIDVGTLLSETVSIRTLELNGLDVELLIDSRGTSNLPALPDAEAGPPEKEATGQSLPFIIHEARISKIRVERHNQQTGVQALLLVDAMALETSGDNRLSLDASGSLQDRAWQLSVSGSGVNSLLSGKDLDGTIEGSLGGLQLTGDYQVPDISNPGNLTINSRVTGTVPERVAALTPLLVAEEPIELRLTVTDSDPGIDVELFADIENLDAHILGSVARPGTLDGLDLAVNLRSKSLSSLSATIGLGETPDYPLQLETRLLRDGRLFEASALSLQAGPHEINGSALLPSLPDTDDATVDLRASGPDFSLYQRLVKRPVSFPVPYSISATLSSGEGSTEILGGKAHIGAHRINFSGELGNYPGYRGSRLNFDAQSPSIRAVGAAFDFELPDAPAQLSGELAISEAGMVELQALNAELLGVTAELTGDLGSYPDSEAMDLSLSGELASLANVSERMGMRPLGDLPVEFALSASGSPQDITVSSVSLQARGLAVESFAGALRWSPGSVTTDLDLRVEVDDLPRLLGDYAAQAVPRERLRFDLSPRIRDDRLQLSVADLRGPGVSGAIDMNIARNLSLDADTRLSSELQLSDPSALLPAIPQFRPGNQPLFLEVQAQPKGKTLELKAQLRDASRQLLNVDAAAPLSGSDLPTRILVAGSGPDLRLLGSHAAFPDQALPFEIDAGAIIDGERTDFTIRKIDIAGTELRGNAQLDSKMRSLSADLEIPQGRLSQWIPQDDPEASESTAKPDTAKKRMIPDYALPLDLMDSLALDVRLSTGPLGLATPNYPEQSLIDSGTVHLTNMDGEARLQINEATGSLGRLQGEVSLNRANSGATLQSALTLEEFPLAIFARDTDFSSLPRHRLDAELSANGSTLRELAASLDGDLLLSGGAGSLGQMKFGFATESFVAQLLQTLLPMLSKSDPNVQVECTVLAARAEAGLIRLDPGFVLRSKRVDLTARGEIDLRSEQLRIRFDNQARKGLGISAASLINPYLEITGTLAKPSIGIDMKNSALSGGAALATGGLTVLAKPLYGRIRALGNPCDTALERWESSTP